MLFNNYKIVHDFKNYIVIFKVAFSDKEGIDNPISSVITNMMPSNIRVTADKTLVAFSENSS